MAKQTEAASGGIGFTGLLTILFIALKLTGHIDWSWKWVLAPIWISAILVIVAIVVALALAAYTGQLSRRRRY